MNDRPRRQGDRPAPNASPKRSFSKPSDARSTGNRSPVGKPALSKPLAAKPSADNASAGEATTTDGVRISKLMSERGLCSRREADAFIEQGLVYVDGVKVTELGTRARPDADITLDRKAHIQQSRQVTIILNKPIGFVSGQPEPGFTPAIDLIREDTHWAEDPQRRFAGGMLKNLAPAGRLDIDSTGLLVLTQEGRIARFLIGEDSTVEKEYLVRVEGRLIQDGLRLLNHGLSLDGKPLKPAKVSWQNEDQLRFVLREGKKRQIRRMCELVGLKVVGLKRIRIGQLKLGALPLGQWRFLGEHEKF